jgi:glycerate 2-kinase
MNSIKRILVAPDSFKESLSAVKVAEYLQMGLLKAFHTLECDLSPISDGGEGFSDAMVTGTKGYKKLFPAHDALMRPIDAEVGFSPDGSTAFIEMAAASGLEKIKPQERNPLMTSTFGTGELLMHAIRAGCSKIILGIGGSATNDGGAGMARAMGARFTDENGHDLPPGGEYLGKLHKIELSGLPDKMPEIMVACDVSNPLTGPSGASAVYGPQKGASPEMVRLLDRNLKHFARIIREQTGIDMETIPGAGAAGGLGGGLMAFCHAHLMSGFTLFAETIGLEKRIAETDLVITGEGCMDSQTLQGKAPFGVAMLAKKYRKPVIGVAGTLGSGYEELYKNGFDLLLSIISKPVLLEEALSKAPELLIATGFQIGKILKLTPEAGVS